MENAWWTEDAMGVVKGRRTGLGFELKLDADITSRKGAPGGVPSTLGDRSTSVNQEWNLACRENKGRKNALEFVPTNVLLQYWSCFRINTGILRLGM